MAILTHRITDIDTLPDIALRLTGSVSNWIDIAKFNRLHAPYISNNILDYYGPPSSKGYLPDAIDASTHPKTFILASAPFDSSIEPGGILLIGQYNNMGAMTYDSLPIQSYNPDTVSVTVTISPINSYDINAHWYVYPSERPTKTIRVGELLYIPNGAGPNIRVGERVYDSLGTDIKLDDNGFLHWSTINSATGSLRITGANPIVIPQGTYFHLNDSEQNYISTNDVTVTSNPVTIVPVRSSEGGTLGAAGKGAVFHLIQSSAEPNVVEALRNATIVAETLLEAPFRPADVETVSGPSNVRQAIINRLGTRLGELVYHSNYGNEAFDYIGVPDNDTSLTLIEAACLDCVQQEGRLSHILGGAIRKNDTSIYVTMSLQIRNSPEQMTIEDIRLKVMNQINDELQIVGK